MLAIPIIVMNIILFVTRPPDAPTPRTDAPGEHSVILDRGRWVEAAYGFAKALRLLPRK